jgi:type II secretory pathway pseudopilin PulG
MQLLHFRRNNGFSLVEMLVYIAILTLLVGVLISSLRAIVTTYRHIKVSRTIETSALTALERITREIKNGESITVGSSTFGNASGSITIVGKSPTETSKTTYIYLQNGVLRIDEDGVQKGQLTSSSTVVTNFTLRFINQTISDAVKVELTLQAGQNDYQRQESFYSTAILRGSY